MSKEVYFSIDENSEGVIQLSINRDGGGYRICGPKYEDDEEASTTCSMQDFATSMSILVVTGLILFWLTQKVIA